MKARAMYWALLLTTLIGAASLVAQEGHPLVGSWHGNWGAGATNRTDMTVVMDWDGKVISGIINPGFDQMMMQNAKLDPKDWSLHFELDRKESSGNTVHCTADGKIDKLGSDRRTLTGTFTCGATKGDFKLTRDRDY
jgi:hypothetical protein